MNKQKLIKEIIKLTKVANKITEEHNGLLNKYKFRELKQIKDSLATTIMLAKAQIEMMKNK